MPKASPDVTELSDILGKEMPEYQDEVSHLIHNELHAYRAKHGKELDAKKAEKVGSDMWETLKESVIKQYLLAEGESYSSKKYQDRGANLLVSSVIGLSREGLIDSLKDTGSLKSSLISNYAATAHRAVDNRYRQDALGMLQDKDNLKKALDHVDSHFHKAGVGLKLKERPHIDASTAVGFLQDVGAGAHHGKTYLADNPRYVSKYVKK